MTAFWNPDGKRANVFYMADKGEPYNSPIYNWVLQNGRNGRTAGFRVTPAGPLSTVSG